MQTYRHEIDGLRAIAVLSVICFHAGFSFCPGGYVGVDVFFVISGYLITSIIISDHQAGVFSLSQFYERRIRRILPALLFVLFCCVPFAFRYMVPDELNNFAQGLLSVLLCLSNVFFWMKEDYFSTDSAFNPLVHTWSLAIEEQFYVLFSFIFSILSGVPHQTISEIFFWIAIISLILAQWSGNLYSKFPFVKSDFLWFSQRDWASYYLLTGRAWELLLGSFTAFYFHNHRFKHRKFNNIGAMLGLCFILFSICCFDVNVPFPSFYTIVPTVGTAFVILFGHSDTLIGRLLSLKVLKKIGLCSYSAYLWHQPLLAFTRLSQPDSTLTLSTRIAIVGLSLLLAYFSWRFIETPFRNKKTFSRHQIFGIAVIAICCMSIVSYGLLEISQTGFGHSGTYFSGNMIQEMHSKTRYDDKDSPEAYLIDLQKRRAVKYTNTRFYQYLNNMTYDEKSKRKRLAIIGDSHAKDFLNMAAENGKLLNYQIRTYYILNACQMYISKDDLSRFILNQYKSICREQYELIQAIPLVVQSDIVILASRWRLWAVEHIKDTINGLNLRKNQKLIIIGSKRFSTTNPKLYQNMDYHSRLALRSIISKSDRLINRTLRKNVAHDSFVDIQRLVCGKHYACPVFTSDNRLVSYDGSHTTPSGAKYVGKIIFNHPPLNTL